MACRTINLESGKPALDEARRRLLSEMEAARQRGVRVLKVIHGYGSTGAGGTLCAGIRKSLRLRVKEGKALSVIMGERFSTDTQETRELLRRHPSLRRDHDLNRANPGVSIVELAPA
jgi:hypothetical protein